MRQWMAEYAIETRKGPVKQNESFYLPTEDHVRNEIGRLGGYVISIRPYQRSPIERWLARSSFWQIQLLRAIQFRSKTNSPGVGLWKLILAEESPSRQNILAPAKEALSRGMGIIFALKSLKIFDHSTMAILAASERSNRLLEGIPHAIENIKMKRKNTAALMGTISWLGIDIVMIVQAMLWGRKPVLGWFEDNKPTDPDKLAEFELVVGNLELLWNFLLVLAFALGGFLAWTILSYWNNRGNKDWPTARIVRSLPLIGGYMRDIGFADSTSAAARMLRGNLQVNEMLEQASEATNVPEVSQFWLDSLEDLNRGIPLGSALDREPMTKQERMEIAGLTDLNQVASVMEAISEMRTQASKTKHAMIVWGAFAFTGVYLFIAFGSAIYALTVMNMSMDSMVNDLLQSM